MKGPRVIRTEVGPGLTTLVPYGISSDVSEAARRLNAHYAKLARAWREREQRQKR